MLAFTLSLDDVVIASFHHRPRLGGRCRSGSIRRCGSGLKARDQRPSARWLIGLIAVVIVVCLAGFEAHELHAAESGGAGCRLASFARPTVRGERGASDFKFQTAKCKLFKIVIARRKRSNPSRRTRKNGLLRRFAPRNDG